MKNGAELLLETLHRHGVETIFGYPGARTLHLHDALLNESRIRHILVRHEQGAAHAADGYARATGKVGVCLTTSGPGATNLVTGIATAYKDSIPLIALTCQVSTTDLGTDAFQEADMVGITRPITRLSLQVKSVDALPAAIDEAFARARSGRPGPVLIDLPSDVLAAVVPEAVALPGAPPEPVMSARSAAPRGDDLERAAAMINAAQRPLIYAGGGVVSADAAESVRRLAAAGSIPVTHTLMGMGVVDAFSPLSVGMLGMYGAYYANRAVAECDCLIALGARFDDRVTARLDGFAPRARILRIDVAPADLGRKIPVEMTLGGDLREILPELCGRILPQRRDSWLAQISQWRETFPLPRPSEAGIAPFEIYEALAAVAGDDPVIAADVGLSQMWTANYYPFSRPRQLLTSGGLGTMGYALPAAVGAALGVPQRPVFAICGDGAFQMNIQELATCSHYRLPVKILLVNNGTLGMVRQFQHLFLDGRYAATDLEVPLDFGMISRGFGVPAFRVTGRNDLATALREAVAHPGPALVEIPMANNCFSFPMIPPGKTVQETLLAPAAES